MKITEEFIGTNDRIQIISNDGLSTPIPEDWRPVLVDRAMIVVIPDMHMFLYKDNLDNFWHGDEAMMSFLRHVSNVKDHLEDRGMKLRVYQIGDMYELKFPGRHANVTAAEIRISSDDYSLICNMIDNLDTSKIYGNHDFENRHFDGYEFNYTQGKIYLEHGFAADTSSANPLLPFWDPQMFLFLQARALNQAVGKLAVELDLIPSDSTFSVGVTSGEVERAGYPLVTDYHANFGRIKQHYCDRLRRGLNGDNCRISIIGHTHHPHLDPNVDDGNYMYVDCGAWTEGRSDFVVVTDEELAICHYKRISSTTPV